MAYYTPLLACNPNTKSILAYTPHRHQLYGHLPPISKIILFRRYQYMQDIAGEAEMNS